MRAHALPPAAHGMQGQRQREVVAHRGYRIALAQRAAQRVAVGQAQAAGAIQRGVTQQLHAAAQLPAQAGRRDARGGARHALAQFGVARGEQAALVDGKPLARGEAEETEVAGQPHAAAVASRTQRLGGVLDHERAHVVGDGERVVHVGDAAGEMGGQDRQRALVAGGAQRMRLHVVVAGAQVAQHGFQPGLAHRQRHQRTGVGGHHHAAARRLQFAQRGQRDQQRGGAGTGEFQRRRAQQRGDVGGQRGRPRAQIAEPQRQAGGGRQLLAAAGQHAHARDFRPAPSRRPPPARARGFRRGPGRRCRRRWRPRPARAAR